MRSGVSAALLLAFVSALALSSHVRAAEAETGERKLTTDEIERWLDAPPGTPAADGGPVDPLEAPPPAPRRHGLVLETGIGAVGHLGPLKNIVPLAPRFELRVGVEPLNWLMIFAEADLVVASTGYASHPPPPRAYTHYGFGSGLRFTLELSERFGVLAQASVGASRISEENVLSVYGFPEADDWNMHLGGGLGVEWYQVNSHLALAAHAGIRSYGDGMRREGAGDTPLAWLGNTEIRYAF
jgi:hypothetical protein